MYGSLCVGAGGCIHTFMDESIRMRAAARACQQQSASTLSARVGRLVKRALCRPARMRADANALGQSGEARGRNEISVAPERLLCPEPSTCRRAARTRDPGRLGSTLSKMPSAAPDGFRCSGGSQLAADDCQESERSCNLDPRGRRGLQLGTAVRTRNAGRPGGSRSSKRNCERIVPETKAGLAGSRELCRGS